MNKSLTELNLYGNSIGDAGAVALVEALKVNKSLTRLYLNSNSISSAGAGKLRTAACLNSSNCTVLGLPESCCTIS